jgi:hypothetical protein
MHHSDFRFKDIFAAAFLVAFLAGPPSSATAAGAVAIGEPKHIAKGGVAVGFAYNFASKDTAEIEALKLCLAFKGAPATTRALCKVVKSYENQCHSIALDPKDGTPGFGWAVMTEQGKADEAALDNCRRTAGKSRVEFCKVTKSGCDNPGTSEKSPPQK